MYIIGADCQSAMTTAIFCIKFYEHEKKAVQLNGKLAYELIMHHQHHFHRHALHGYPSSGNHQVLTPYTCMTTKPPISLTTLIHCKQ